MSVQEAKEEAKRRLLPKDAVVGVGIGEIGGFKTKVTEAGEIEPL